MPQLQDQPPFGDDVSATIHDSCSVEVEPRRRSASHSRCPRLILKIVLLGLYHGLWTDADSELPTPRISSPPRVHTSSGRMLSDPTETGGLDE